MSDIFKVLRCRCGKQSRVADPAGIAPDCPKCGSRMEYSANWYIKVWVNGKRHIQSAGRQRRQAESLLKRAHDDVFQAKFFEPEPEDPTPLLSDALDTTWKRKWKNNRDGAKSKRLVERIIDIVGDIRLSQFGESTYDELIDALEERGIAPSTVNRYRSALKTVLRRVRTPYDFIEMDPEDFGRIRVISRHEEEAALRVFSADFKGLQAHYTEMRDLLPCLIDTGARTSEMLQLPWRDVDFDSGLITIWKNKSDRPRSVPMTGRVEEILTRRKESHPERPWALTLWQLDRIWQWLRKELDLQDDKTFRAYCTRHTCATRLVAVGTDIYRVMKWMGHTSIKMTERYAHLDPNLLKDAAAALENRQLSTNRQQELQVAEIA